VVSTDVKSVIIALEFAVYHLMTTLNHPSLTLAEIVAEAELAYYRQVEQFFIGKQEILGWYSKLPIQEQAELRLLPLAQWLFLPAFRQAALERRGYWLDRYMEDHLTKNEWTFWVNSKKSVVACWVALPDSSIINRYL
jgi:hypothetical protein